MKLQVRKPGEPLGDIEISSSLGSVELTAGHPLIKVTEMIGAFREVEIEIAEDGLWLRGRDEEGNFCAILVNPRFQAEHDDSENAKRLNGQYVLEALVRPKGDPTKPQIFRTALPLHGLIPIKIDGW